MHADERLRLFISHNSNDKPIARRLGVALQLVADVWFDEWEIRAGDSIPGRINAALTDFDTLLLVWSEHAASSRWVESELNSAISASNSDRRSRIIPVTLDETPLPSLIADRRRVDLTEPSAITEAVDLIMGFSTVKQRRKAVQQGLSELDLEMLHVPGVGTFVGCQRCGADLHALKGTTSVDHERDDTYVQIECSECGWCAWGEI